MRTHGRAYTLANAKADVVDALERANANAALANAALANAARERGDAAKARYFDSQSRWWRECADMDAKRVAAYERAGYGQA